MQSTIRNTAALLVTLLVTLLVATVALPGAAGNSDTQTATYDAPTSFVIRDVFGFGKLLCADADTAPLADTVSNGACFTYTTADVGRPFRIVADDAVWDNASIAVAVDVKGDGCISASCSGQPNPANDYRVDACGAVDGVLPDVDPGVSYTLQVFLRAADVGADGSACGATTGTVTFTLE